MKRMLSLFFQDVPCKYFLSFVSPEKEGWYRQLTSQIFPSHQPHPCHSSLCHLAVLIYIWKMILSGRFFHHWFVPSPTVQFLSPIPYSISCFHLAGQRDIC